MTRSQVSPWILVPARGGSRRIPRKNLLLLAGKPLIRHVLDTLSSAFGPSRVVVSTDSPEIEALCKDGFLIHKRDPFLARDETTLDEVALSVAQWLLKRGAGDQDILLTVQPTSPFLKSETITRALAELESSASVLSVHDDRHLRWTISSEGKPEPLFKKRTNRQWQAPCLAETGGLIGCRIKDLLEFKSRIIHPVSLIETSDMESLDIDTPQDFHVAEVLATRRKIIIRADGSPKIGLGHIYRALALAQEFALHDLTLATRKDGPYELGARIFSRFSYKRQELSSEEEFRTWLQAMRPHITILDILDTEIESIQTLRSAGGYLVHFEDLGPGAALADLVVNDLYSGVDSPSGALIGPDYSVVSPAFETLPPSSFRKGPVKQLVVTFGGTDPSDLTRLALRGIEESGYRGQTTVILGPGYPRDRSLPQKMPRVKIMRDVKNMALELQDVELGITSAGRTVTELFCLGIPVVVLCQNQRELLHSHASLKHGALNLGLGQNLSPGDLGQKLSTLLGNSQLRQDLAGRALHTTRNRSNQKLARLILHKANSALKKIKG